jgi:hypothetical protein
MLLDFLVEKDSCEAGVITTPTSSLVGIGVPSENPESP